MLTFKSAIELAKYIKSLNISELQEEQLMLRGVQHKNLYGVYAI